MASVKAKPLRGKVRFRASSLNVGTLTDRSAEVVETLTRRKVDLCCLQEIRMSRSNLERDQAKLIEGKDTSMKLYWCGNDRGHGGVGILLALKWIDKVICVRRISDRIILLKMIIGKQIYAFISLYAPQVGRSAAEKERFYDQLLSVVSGIPSSEVLFCLGDWNGHVGREAQGFEKVHGGRGFGERNDEGVSILEFAVANNLLVGNTWFIKRESHLITYCSGDDRTQVDYALYRQGFRNAVTDVKVIPGEECAPQHHLLVVDFTVRPPPPKVQKFTPRLRSWKLRDPVTASEYLNAFNAKTTDASTPKNGTPVENAWSKLKDPLNAAAAETCGFSKKHQWKRQTWWWNKDVNTAIDVKRTLFKAYKKLRKQGNSIEAKKAKEAYREAKRLAKREVWSAKSAASEETFKEVDPLGSNVYRIARQMARTNQDIIGEKCVLNDDNELAITDEDKMKAWVQHYDRLLNVEFPWPKDSLPEVEPTAGPPPPVTTKQVRAALSKMKCGKAAGPSGIIAEMLKASGEQGIELVRQLGQEVFSSGEIPSDWEKSTILNLFKGKGDALQRGNYRGLKLTDQVMKLLERVLDSTIRGMVNVDEMQFGFVPGKGTTDAIFIVRQLQEKCLASGQPLYFAFVDLEKAFDRVPRKVLWWALRSLGVEEWVIRVIQGMYANARSRVQVNGQYSEEFEVGVGVHQGSVLSPLLFILVLEALSREFRTGSHVPWELFYADDLVIIAYSLEECIERLEKWKDNMEAKGLHVNLSKTKFLVSGEGFDVLKDKGTYPCAVCRNGVGDSNAILCTACNFWVHGGKKCSGIDGKLKSSHAPGYVCLRCQGHPSVRPIDGRPHTSVSLGSTTLEVVDEFCYLGDMIGAGGGCENAIITRCSVAWGKFRKLLPILSSRHIPFTVRGRVFNACVRSAMLHGSETWGPKSKDQQRLRRNDRAMVRWICGVKPQDNSSYEQLLSKLGLVDIASELSSRRLRWYGHVMRSSDCIHTVRNLVVPGERTRGRPKKTWYECVKGDIRRRGLEKVDPLDRISWRRGTRNRART